MLQVAIKDLKKSGISIEDADRAGMFSEISAQDVYDDFQDCPGLVIPYFDPWTDDFMTFQKDNLSTPFCRVRYYPVKKSSGGFVFKKEKRYSQPSSSGVFPYFARTKDIDWLSVFKNTSCPIVITEGEKKALRACLSGVPTIGLGGVYNFSKNGALLPQLENINWLHRPVYICYDSDAGENPKVQAAEGRLATELSIKHRAAVFLARLPCDGSDKVGLDDFIVDKGENAFLDLLENAPRMRKIDEMVLNLNEEVCFIQREGVIFERKKMQVMGPTTFLRGSQYSALKTVMPTTKGTGVRTVSVVNEWMTHPHALRYDSITFEPSKAEVIVDSNGRRNMNTWRGLTSEKGDIDLFMDLTRHVFSEMEGDKYLPLKLMAYRAQNPHIKVPLAILLVGEGGSGKSLWAKTIAHAFYPYCTFPSSTKISSEFNAWLEDCLVAVFDEVEPKHMEEGSEILKQWISGKEVLSNEKYKVERMVNTYNTIILTSNDRDVAVFAQDDRRMIVVGCPSEVKEPEFYDEYGEWFDDCGPKRVMHFLLNWDLKGWKPPKKAPMTSEKYMAYVESLTPIQRVAEEMRTSKVSIIKLWHQAARAWAEEAIHQGNIHEMAQAKNTLIWLKHAEVRPWYTAEELTAMFPALTASLHGKGTRQGTSAGAMSRQLRQAGVRYLRNSDDPRGFRHQGRIKQYLVVAEIDNWKESISQAEFDEQMESFRKKVRSGLAGRKNRS